MGSPVFRNPLLQGIVGYPYRVGDGAHPGPKREGVRKAQMVLMQVYFPIPGSTKFGSDPKSPVTYTGVFDKEMKRVVETFQAKYSLEVTGVIDESTLREMDSLSVPTAMDFYTPNGVAQSGTVPFLSLHAKEAVAYENTDDGWAEWVEHVKGVLGHTPSAYGPLFGMVKHLTGLCVLFNARFYDFRAAKARGLFAEAVSFPGGVRPHSVTKERFPLEEFTVVEGTFAAMQYNGAVLLLEDGCSYKLVGDSPEQILCTPVPDAVKKRRFPRLRRFVARVRAV